MAQNLKDTKEWQLSQLLPFSHWQLSIRDVSQFNQFLIDGYLDDTFH